MQVIKKQKKDLGLAIFFLLLFLAAVTILANEVIFSSSWEEVNPILVIAAALSAPVTVYGSWNFFKIYFKGYSKWEPIDN